MQDNDSDLDALLARAALQAPRPSEALMDRVLQDALRLQPQRPAMTTPRPAVQQGIFARISTMFGGGPVLAGVLSAAFAGVALGYSNPAALDMLTGGLTAGLTGDETLDLFPSADFLTIEG